MIRPSWRDRALRARALVAQQPAASEVLEYYAGLLELQARFAEESGAGPIAHMPRLLDYVEGAGSTNLRERAAELRSEGSARWESLIAAPGEDALSRFFAMAVLQPHRERVPCDVHEVTVSVLTEAADGLKRSLVCGICQHQWDTMRIHCPFCEEQRFEALPVFAVEEFEHLRIEACETCKRYLLSVNMAKSPGAVPTVDDIGALAVHLWAQEHGYTRAHLNLFGY